MKKMWLFTFFFILLIHFSSCGGDEEEPDATITGTLTLQVGVTGDLNNTRVAIYTSYDDWQNDMVLQFVMATGSGNAAAFTINNVPPGGYFLDAWKDVDSSTTWNAGDLFGVYGTTQWPNPILSPFNVSTGETFTADVTVIMLP